MSGLAGIDRAALGIPTEKDMWHDTAIEWASKNR